MRSIGLVLFFQQDDLRLIWHSLEPWNLNDARLMQMQTAQSRRRRLCFMNMRVLARSSRTQNVHIQVAIRQSSSRKANNYGYILERVSLTTSRSLLTTNSQSSRCHMRRGLCMLFQSFSSCQRVYKAYTNPRQCKRNEEQVYG